MKQVSNPDISVVVEGVIAGALERYGEVSIAFTVDSKMVIAPSSHDGGGWKLTEMPVDPPWIKDYDDGEPPTRWLRWDTSDWRIFMAFVDGDHVGGAVVACRTPAADFLEGRDDIAALWDIRVAPGHRGKGVGSTLFRYVLDYCSNSGVRELKIETQDINARACKFYSKQGCRLAEVTPEAYPEWPDEIELIWRISL